MCQPMTNKLTDCEQRKSGSQHSTSDLGWMSASQAVVLVPPFVAAVYRETWET